MKIHSFVVVVSLLFLSKNSLNIKMTSLVIQISRKRNEEILKSGKIKKTEFTSFQSP